MSTRVSRRATLAECAPSRRRRSSSAQTVKYVYWQEDAMWLGYLDEYPDYMTQGESLKELEENLKDIYSDVTQGHVPGVEGWPSSEFREATWFVKS